jgi:hypothetical protein
MRVHVDESRRDNLAGGVDLGPTFPGDFSESHDAIALHRDVTQHGRFSGSIDEPALTDDEIVVLAEGEAGDQGEQRERGAKGKARHKWGGGSLRRADGVEQSCSSALAAVRDSIAALVRAARGAATRSKIIHRVGASERSQ